MSDSTVQCSKCLSGLSYSYRIAGNSRYASWLSLTYRDSSPKNGSRLQIVSAVCHGRACFPANFDSPTALLQPSFLRMKPVNLMDVLVIYLEQVDEHSLTIRYHFMRFERNLVAAPSSHIIQQRLPYSFTGGLGWQVRWVAQAPIPSTSTDGIDSTIDPGQSAYWWNVQGNPLSDSSSTFGMRFPHVMIIPFEASLTAVSVPFHHLLRSTCDVSGEKEQGFGNAAHMTWSGA